MAQQFNKGILGEIITQFRICKMLDVSTSLIQQLNEAVELIMIMQNQIMTI